MAALALDSKSSVWQLHREFRFEDRQTDRQTDHQKDRWTKKLQLLIFLDKSGSNPRWRSLQVLEVDVRFDPERILQFTVESEDEGLGLFVVR